MPVIVALQRLGVRKGLVAPAACVEGRQVLAAVCGLAEMVWAAMLRSRLLLFCSPRERAPDEALETGACLRKG